jgi:hypothetical protein
LGVRRVEKRGIKEGGIKIRIRIKIRRGKEDGLERDKKDQKDERDQNETNDAGAWKASAFAKATADQPVAAARRTAPGDAQMRAHAQELITFSPRQKTDWGKKRIFLKICFNHGSTGLTRIWGRENT